jgi:hypothetical protein
MLIFALVIALTGCRTNNGDIGVYYGSWALKSVTIDGVEDTAWSSDNMWTTWSFQNNVICISRTNDLQDMDTRWGTWSEDNGKLLLDFRHSDDNAAAGSGQYAAPSWLYFERNTVTTLGIDAQTSKSMTLSIVDANGRKIVYTLKKT